MDDRGNTRIEDPFEPSTVLKVELPDSAETVHGEHSMILTSIPQSSRPHIMLFALPQYFSILRHSVIAVLFNLNHWTEIGLN